ncbi:Sds3-like-domain-containing protein [Talaromyces proteolyticus]|uniref:Sds3-like-domain-containing protein n=1 Tax=Talaromyces proteolyticus TaxID=1131652 RepID=A0AAD4L065_9EURO|nr:Sds3-like-domain-containing protein [Talaromyces proteolyticus]KAH8701085.1 Sds3-like-domain-containing protein [Talaromyces proteolyticus]
MMDVIESAEPVVQSTSAVDSATSGPDASMFIDDPLGDDDRSSSLSEIDDVSENELFDNEPLHAQESALAEADSEAETERLEDSPRHPRNLRNINLSSTNRFESSPSKLAQSTTYDEADDDEHEMDETPSKARQLSNENGVMGDEEEDEDDENEEEDETGIAAGDDPEKLPTPPDVAGKKRKRLLSADVEADLGDNEPLRKRRGSLKSEIGDELPIETPLSHEGTEDASKHEISRKGTPLEDAQDLDVPAVATRGKKGKRGKRRGRKAKDADEDMENGDSIVEGTEDQLQEDEETGEAGDDADDAEATAKSEEEMARKVAAIDALGILEKEFSTLRDKIYDEKIARVDQELEQLTSSEPTHPELLRQLECVRRHRDTKIKYERTLFQYRLQSLLSRSLADRAQTHSTFFQRVRDTRERHSTAVSKHFYAIQHDRFKTEELGAHHYIPFPTRRSQQISQQAAYNQEVSVMAGVAKYVGFPAAPSLSAARIAEIDEDLEKMGISIEHRPVMPQGTGSIRGTISAGLPRYNTAEESFQEVSTWGNPQIAQTNRQSFMSNMASFTTPASQKRVVDIHAPNGSASTIADNASAANSSTANTPYGVEQENRPFGAAPFNSIDHDNSGRKTGFRSQSSSPLDVRKSYPNQKQSVENTRHDATRNSGFSPPTRFGLFGSSKQETSPPLSSKPLGGIHSSAGLVTGSGSSRMIAR